LPFCQPFAHCHAIILPDDCWHDTVTLTIIQSL